MILTIKNHRYTVKDWEDVMVEAKKFYEKYTRKNKKSGKIRTPSQDFLRDKNPALYHQLRLWGYTFSGKLTPKYALKEMGIDISYQLSIDEIKDQFRSVFTPEYISTFLEEPGRRSRIESRMTQAGNRQRQAYYSCFFKKRKISLKGIVNSLYPEYPELYELLSGSSLTDDLVCRTLTGWYYAGLDLSPEAVEHRNSVGGRIKHLLQKKMAKNNGHSKKYWRNMLSFLDIPRISESDIRVDNDNERSAFAILVELQTEFLLRIVEKYDPGCQEMGSAFRKRFGHHIKKIYRGTNTRNVKLSGGKIYADGRIVSESDQGLEHILLEVKNKNRINNMFYSRLKKYRNQHTWADGEDISKKVLFLNTIDDRVNEHSGRLEAEGWDVWTREQFYADYVSAIGILAKNNPCFFQTSLVPLHDPEQILQIVREITETPHILMRRPHAYKMNWMKEFFEQSIISLKKGITAEENRTYAMVNQKDFSDFSVEYRGQENVSAPGVLFLDLETTGHVKNGSMIVLLGMAYERDGKMQTELLFARNPLEERELLERFQKMATDYDTIVTFNGERFDMPFLQERMNAHFIRPARKWKDIDMYKDYYKRIAKTKGYPAATLQTYERAELGFVRSGDIPGKLIPEVYANFIRGKRDSRVRKIIDHNHFDLVSLAIMYNQYYDKPAPRN